MGCAKCHDVRLLELALQDVENKTWDSKLTKGTFRGVITRRKEKRETNAPWIKAKSNNLESKNMEQKKKFCFRPMMLKQHLCANQLKVPRCVQSWLLENTKKKNSKCKVQTHNFYLWFAKHVLKTRLH